VIEASWIALVDAIEYKFAKDQARQQATANPARTPQPVA